MMHCNVAKIILEAYPDVPIIPIEDAYIGVVAAYSRKVQPMLFGRFVEEDELEDNCQYVSSYHVHHRVSAKQILDLWNLCVCDLMSPYKG